jgi:HD domain
MALKFLACTIRPSNSRFADLILNIWYEYEAGETRLSLLVRQLDKLECIDQAIIYEERYGLDLSEFMALKEQVTLPELQPWLKIRLQEYDDLMLRKKAEIVVVFVSGMTSMS